MKARKTAADLARKLQEARDIEATETMLDEAELRVATHLERQILVEQARNPGLLNQAQVEGVKLVESDGESIWSGMPDMLVRMIVAVRIQKFVDKS